MERNNSQYNFKGLPGDLASSETVNSALILKDIRRLCKRKMRHLERKRQKIAEDLEDAGKWKWYRCMADSLLVCPKNYPKGTVAAEILNIHTDKKESISLNPKLDAIANSRLLYKKAKKGERGQKIIEQRLRETEREILQIESIIEECAQTDNFPNDNRDAYQKISILDLKCADLGIIVASTGGEKRKKEDETGRYRRFVVKGYEVYIGRNNSQNDELSTRFARPWHIWMHVTPHAGSHVVIKREKNSQWPPKEVIDKAASLAVWFSKAKHSSACDVHVTEARFVRKPRGSAPGEVVAERCKTVRVAPVSPQEMFT